MSSPWSDEPHPCPWPKCRCTHPILVCVAGWLDDDLGTTPCPQCRPEAANHLNTSKKTIRNTRRELPTLDRPSRSAKW